MQNWNLTHSVSEIGSFCRTEETNQKYIWKVKLLNIYISKLIFVNYVDGTFSENTTIFITVVHAFWEP